LKMDPCVAQNAWIKNEGGVASFREERLCF
jgi:hypothetical protein